MISKFKFKKLSDRWFIDIPYSGSVDDLEMVYGADKLLDYIDTNKVGEVELSVFTQCEDSSTIISKVEENEIGATYFVDGYTFRGNIWLCNVTKLLFGEFPDTFYVQI